MPPSANVHPEAPADINKDPADLASDDYADGLAVKVKTHKAAQGKVELSGTVIRLVDATHGSQQESNGVFRHRIGRVRGHMHHMDFSESCLTIKKDFFTRTVRKKIQE